MLLLGFIPLLAVLTAGSFGAAFPQHALRKGCSLFKYKFLVPHETKAMQKMKQHFVSTTGNAGGAVGWQGARWRACQIRDPE